MIKKWIIDHDDSWLFIIGYIGLAVALSIAISLFWLLVVVLIHFLFELIKYNELIKQRHGLLKFAVILNALREVKLDIGLFMLALALAVYMDVILGIAGISSGVRLGVQGTARFAGWQHTIRGILLSADDAAQLIRLGAEKGGKTEQKYLPLSFGEYLSISLGIISLILIVVSPFLIEINYNTLLQTIVAELDPWPL